MCLGCTWGHPHCRLPYRAGNIYLLDLQRRCWLQLQWVVTSLCHWFDDKLFFFFASSYCCEFPLSRAIGCSEINIGLLFHLASLKILFPHVHTLAFYFRLGCGFCCFWLFGGFFSPWVSVWRFPSTHVWNTHMDWRPCMELPIMLFSHRCLLKK